MSAPTKDQDEEKKGSWLRTILITVFVGLILLNLPVPCQSHDHHHDHDHENHEPPSFKYSQQANEHPPEQASHGHAAQDHDHHHHHHDEEEKPHLRPMVDYEDHQGDVFIQAMGSTLLISAAPFLILFFVPLDNTKEREPLLKILLSFASGGLLGDAFLHLIPHALPYGHSHDDHEHGHSHDHEHGEHHHEMSVGLCVLAGIITFLLVEKTVRLIKGDHHHHHGEPEDKMESKVKKDTSDKKKKKDGDSNKQTESDNSTIAESKEPVDDIKVAGYLNLAADFLHNFTDGLAIGASYLAGNSVGYVTTFTILLHEVPHEIGDFAILVQSGCSKPKVIILWSVCLICNIFERISLYFRL